LCPLFRGKITLLPVEDNGDNKKKKTFKDYEPGYIHVDVKYLPKMPDEENRKYLFVAIDRASRWVYLDIFPDKSAKSAETFLMDVVEDFPGKITKLLTDNGKEFTDRFCRSSMRKPTGNHIFDNACAQNNIEHRLTKPRSPQTNGMVERFNGRIATILKSTRFKSSQDLKKTLQNYLFSYNNVIGQRALKHKTPMKFLALSLNQPNLADPDS
jgi:transposase InsO family protein